MNGSGQINSWSYEIFNLEVLESSKLVLLEVGASWSGASHIISSILESVAITYNNRIKVFKLDIESNEEIKKTYSINEIPAILFFKDGKLADKIIGIVSKKVITNRISLILNGANESESI